MEKVKNALVLPTSDMTIFEEMLNNPGKCFRPSAQNNSAIVKIKKDLVMSFVSDSSGVGHIRNIFPLSYINSVLNKTETFNLITSQIIIHQPEYLVHARSLFFQRRMNPAEVPVIAKIKELQKKFGYKLVYEIDDFIWTSDDKFEGLPEYNFGKKSITPEVQKACVDIMRMMDHICVSTKYLGDYISRSFDIDPNKIVHVPNTVGQFFWGTKQKKPITQKLVKPRVIWTASPTHWNDETKMLGDMTEPWLEWLRKSIVDGKIEYTQMGGCPWFLQDIRDKITVIDWVDSYKYHVKVMQARPDFGIGPLTPNLFNFSKSSIKMIEQYAAGSVFVGTHFKDVVGGVSPYDDSFVSVSHETSAQEISEVFDYYSYPEHYNDVLAKQYKRMKMEGLWTESERNVNLLTSVL